jgi:3-oxoisoapionate decarboxylase
MHVGIGSYTWPWAVGINGFSTHQPLTAMGLLQRAIQHGIHRVQIADNLPLHLLNAEQQKELKLFATEHHIQIETGTRGLKKDLLLIYLKLAVRYRSPFLRVVIDDENYYPSVAEIISIINEVLPAFKKENVMLAIENHDRFPAKILEEIIIATDKEQVAICLDTANSLGCGEGINEVCYVLAPYTINLHIKDYSIRRIKTKMGFTIEGASAGKGQLPLLKIINALRPYNRCSSAILEVWSPAATTPQETIEREEEWVNNSITYLKETIKPFA